MRFDEMGEMRELSKGSEGTVYKLLNCNKCVKIFHSKEIAEEKKDKIKFMTGVSSLKKRTDISWPQECIYDKYGQFIGYIMNFAPEGSNPLTSYFNARMYHLDTHLLVHCAMNLIRTSIAIHKEGITICDFNPNNILINERGDCFFVDVDNYQFRTKNAEYKPAVACSMYLNKNIQALIGEAMSRGIPLTKIVPSFPYGTFNRKTDIWSMCVVIFQILMNGTHPFTGKFDGENIQLEVNIYHDYSPYFGKGVASDLGADKPSIKVMSKELTTLFYNVFFGEFEVEEVEEKLLSVLNTYSHSLIQECSRNKNHYYINSINKCPWCEIDCIKSIPKSCSYSSAKKTVIPPLISSNMVNRSTVMSKNTRNVSNSDSSIGKQIVQPQTVNNSKITSMIYNNTSPVHKYNLANARATRKKSQEKGCWMWGVFILSCIVQIYLFGAGYIKDFYAANVGGIDNMMILGPLGQYLLLVVGLAVCFFITIVFIESGFEIFPSIILDMATQVGAYLALIWMYFATPKCNKMQSKNVTP